MTYTPIALGLTTRNHGGWHLPSADGGEPAMIYPNRDKTTDRLIPNSYLIGWEYSTNDDFQDVVCQVDNVVLLEK